MSLRSEPGQGSCFTVSVPLPAATGPLPVDEGRTVGAVRVLLADDDRQQLDHLEKLSRSLGWQVDVVAGGLPLVVLGQFSYIVSIATLTISARLKRFDPALEEAAYNLGASRAAVLWTITLPYLKPALVGAGAISFLMSFENFNTTLMLVGSDAPLTVMMYGRMREGASPVLNAVSLLLMLASAALAVTLMRKPASAQG